MKLGRRNGFDHGRRDVCFRLQAKTGRSLSKLCPSKNELPKTLGQWARQGRIRSLLLPGTGVREHRLYDMTSLSRVRSRRITTPVRFGAPNSEDPNHGTVVGTAVETRDGEQNSVIYARVSAPQHRGHLEEQIATLQKKYPKATPRDGAIDCS